MKKNMKSILAIAMALILSLALFTGCGAANAPGTELAAGGTLFLKVNPEIAVHYDADGNVTGVESRNADAEAILANYTGFEGKSTQNVVAKLVTVIGEAGYFVEEIEGERRQITIEIEPGSSLPSDTFLTDVADKVRIAVNAHDWTTPVNLDDVTIYDDTDYGPGNDGVTDYDHNLRDDTDYGPNNDGVTDYGTTDYLGNTDYGPNADGNTDYNDTDYGVWGDGVTDYTDYGATTPTTPAAKPSTGTSNTGSSGTSNAGRTDYGDTDYGDTDYGPNNDGVTDYNDTNYGTSPYDGTDYR